MSTKFVLLKKKKKKNLIIRKMHSTNKAKIRFVTYVYSVTEVMIRISFYINTYEQ